MARTINIIQADILTAIQNDSTLSGLSSGSASAIYRLFSYIVAASIWVLEVLFDSHKTEITNIITTQKPHSLRWYVGKAKAFQFGSALPDGSDVYDNSALTDSQIATQKIVSACAAVEQNNRVLIKAAAISGGLLNALTNIQYNALLGYLTEIKDAGVHLDLISQTADRFKLKIDIFYDNQILGADGARLDGTSAKPVRDTILSFLQNIPFDAIFVKSKLTDALQAVEGVIVPEIRSAQAARFDVIVWQPIDVFYQPYAGYLKFYDDVDLQINYIAV